MLCRQLNQFEEKCMDECMNFITAAILSQNSWVNTGVSSDTNKSFVAHAALVPVRSLERLRHAKQAFILITINNFTRIHGQFLVNLATMKRKQKNTVITL